MVKIEIYKIVIVIYMFFFSFMIPLFKLVTLLNLKKTYIFTYSFSYSYIPIYVQSIYINNCRMVLVFACNHRKQSPINFKKKKKRRKNVEEILKEERKEERKTYIYLIKTICSIYEKEILNLV